MKAAFTTAAAIVALTASSPALAQTQSSAQSSAQPAGLNEGQIEFFSEMLAMGDVCGQLPNFNVERSEMQSWMTTRLAQESDDDLDAIFETRDRKLNELTTNAALVNQMDDGFGRRDASEEHFLNMVTRCNRLVNHSLSGQYFQPKPRA